jgi:hypothetical protein
VSKNDYGFTPLSFIVNQKAESASPSVAIECSLSTRPCHRCGAIGFDRDLAFPARGKVLGVLCKLIAHSVANPKLWLGVKIPAEMALDTELEHSTGTANFGC